MSVSQGQLANSVKQSALVTNIEQGTTHVIIKGCVSVLLSFHLAICSDISMLQFNVQCNISNIYVIMRSNISHIMFEPCILKHHIAELLNRVYCVCIMVSPSLENAHNYVFVHNRSHTCNDCRGHLVYHV